MNDGRAQFSTDEEVATRILSVLRDARKYAILVTPYLKLWGHAEDAIEVAVRNGVDVYVIVRDDPQTLSGEHVGWLLDHGVRVGTVEDLHAKIYLNENSVVLSSMNLTAGSTSKSLDFSVELREPEIVEEVRDYVNRTVAALADEVKKRGVVGQFFAKIADAVRGYCVRCGRAIPRDPAKPMCGDCYEVWAEWKKRDYAEKVCHSCGQAASTSYAKPLCGTCFRRG